MGRPRTITESQESIVISAVTRGLSCEQAARLVNLCGGSARNILRRNNVSYIVKNKAITAEQQQFLLEACLSGMNATEAAALLGVDKSSVCNLLKRQKIKSVGKHPTCSLDHSAFDTLTPESLYWIGFLFADGCVSYYRNSSPMLSLGLAEKDRNHVEKFRDFLKSTHAVRRVQQKQSALITKERTAFYFCVRSRRLAAALRRYGFVRKGPERTPTSDLANSIDFWRGCIDGDGMVTVVTDSKGYKYPLIGLCGHLPLIKSFQQFIRGYGINCNINFIKKGNIYAIRTCGTRAVVLIRLLYANTVLALERKHARAREILKK